MNTSTLKAALRHLEKMLQVARKQNRTGDALVLEVAIDSINYRIEQEDQARQRAQVDREIDRIINRIMTRAGMSTCQR